MSVTDVFEPGAQQRLVLYDMDWAGYQQMSALLNGRHVRLTYDGGALEFMTISPRHAMLSRLFARLVQTLTEELGLPILSCGDMTCAREDLLRGLEPDECFYVTHEPDVRGKTELDFHSDPPPDLAIEIDISRDSRSRLPIYEALGIPEVWRVQDDAVTAYVLDADGAYRTAANSQCIPSLLIADLLPFVRSHDEQDENSLMRSFRAWVTENFTGD